MKSYLTVFVIIAVVQGSDWKEKVRQMEEKYDEVKMICAAKHDITHDELKDLEVMQTPTTTREKCISECYLTESGLMKDGKFSRAGSDSISEYLYDDDLETLQIAKEVSRRCEKDVEMMKLNDGCDVAAAAIRCMRRVSKQMGLKQTSDY